MLRRISFLVVVTLFTVLTACNKSPDALEETRSTPVPDDSLAADTTLAGRYFAQAAQFLRTAKYDSALVYFKKASLLYESEEKWERYVKCFNAMGESAWRSGAYEQALEYLDHALATGVDRLGESHPENAINYTQRGILYFLEAEYEQAIQFCNQALSIYAATQEEDGPVTIRIYNVLGIVYETLGDYEQALIYHNKALAAELVTVGEQHPLTASTYNNMGNVFSSKGDYDQALEWYRKALAIDRITKNEDHPDLAGSYYNIGNVNFKKGDYDQAISYYEEALSIQISSLGEMNHEVAESYNSMGVAYDLKDKDDKALAFYEKALSIRLHTWGEQHPSVAQSYHNIGTLYEDRSDYDQALAVYQKALSIRLAKLGNNHPLVASTYSKIGTTYSARGNDDRALASLNTSLLILQDLLGENHPNVAASYKYIGDIYLRKKDYDKAIQYFQEAIGANVPGFRDPNPYINPSLDDILSAMGLLRALDQKARALASRYATPVGDLRDLEEAVSTHLLATQLIDKIQRSYKAEGSKLLLAENSTEFYDHAIQTALRLYYATGQDQHLHTAFRFAEKSKAGILREALNEIQAQRFAGIPDTLLARERQLRIDLAGYETSLAQERNQPLAAQDSTRIATFQNKLFGLGQEYQTLIQQFEQDYPDYYRLKYQTRTASTDELQQHLLDEETALIEYFVGADSLFIFTLTHDDLHVTSVAIDSSLGQQVAQLRKGIGSDPNDLERAPNYERYVESAYRLYQTLMAPIRDQLRVQHLIIVPDGVLNAVPFAALLTREVSQQSGLKDYRTLPYLVQDYSIRYAYSATLLLETLEREREAAPRDLLAFAPVFPNGVALDSLLDVRWSSTRTSNGALPATKDEVYAIRDLFQSRYGFFERLFGKRTRVYLEEQASEARIKTPEMEQYRFIHLATHGLANEATPELSHLRLAEEDTTAAEDGILYLSEVYNLRLNAELVVLSACQTGLGQVAQGEGVIGLARAFSYAGAEGLVVSLWPVWDESTRVLMVDFYGKLLDGKAKAEALRQAKRSMIGGDTHYAMPYYWAPFILIGQ